MTNAMILTSVASLGAASAATSTKLGVWDGEAEVELYSAVITARSCAREMAQTGNLSIIDTCPPMQAALTGFALYDTMEEQAYMLDPNKVYKFELELGFGGSVDIYGEIKGTSDGLPVITPEEYTITPRPKPDAFKGCL